MINSDLSGKLAIDANGLNKLKLAAKDNSPAAVKAVASQFEALFVNMMLKSMRDATPQEGMFDNEQSKTFTSMLDQQLSQNMASHGIGLADMMTRQLTRASGIKPDSAANGLAINSTDAETANLMPSISPHEKIKNEKLENSKIENEKTQGEKKPPTANISLNNLYRSSATMPTKPLSGGALSFQQMVSGHAEQVSRETGIPASFMIGQAALESGWGKRQIHGLDGTPSNNLFGIKANASWKGKVVEAVTSEYVNGIKQKRIEKFRAYDSYAETFQDFAQLIQKNPRYGKVMANLDNVHNYANAIQKSGYATDPNYASKLISVVQKVAVS